MTSLLQEYRELDMKLTDVAINEYTSSELLRLCLRDIDTQYDTCSTASDDSDIEHDQDDVVGLVSYEVAQR